MIKVLSISVSSFISRCIIFILLSAVVTLYATLGEEAIIHGLNETEVEVVLTSHDQLPKFKKVLQETPSVKKVIFMEDPLNKTDTSGYREDVEILAFCDVIAKGSRSNKGKYLQI